MVIFLCCMLYFPLYPPCALQLIHQMDVVSLHVYSAVFSVIMKRRSDVVLTTIQGTKRQRDDSSSDDESRLSRQGSL